ncbi:acetyltransferase fucose-4-O-acetylase [Luteimicrobium album]|uniref:Acetyltransferase fucose-4-O-acetylase n=2 Tax=Luteimicrobium album TaxID=1054550 RepID=A0ABQ6I2X0_9MICO|nr:acetyltransferase fucose-4-O-acetylase [Luteimicrobium album]
MGTRSSDALYTWIYAFHMPAFVLISGYLSKSFTASARQSKALVATLLVPYVVFRTIHEVERWLVTGGFSVKLFNPSFALWFLLALFVWRLATPILRVLRYPFILAVILFVTVPLDSSLGTTFTLGRIFGFLPYFVLGLVLRPEYFEILRRTWARWVGAGVLVLGAIPAWIYSPRLAHADLYLRGSYESAGHGWLDGALLRLLLLAIGITGTAAVLAVTSRAQTWCTVVGRNSLTVYLLQAAIIFPLNLQSLPGGAWGAAGTVTAAIAGVVLAAFLGSPLVERATHWMVRPPTGWLLRRAPEPA